MKGVIDIGSNSVLLLLGERGADGRVEVLRDEARITRLGQGAAKSGRLAPEAIERTLAVLKEYRALAQEAGAPIVAVATEGLRLASDPAPFLHAARDVLGCDVRMISGDEEAELSYRSVAAEEPPGPLRVLDIGGASTELVVGDAQGIHERRSHRIGSVRLTEAHVEHDPPTMDELHAMAEAARAAFATQPLPHHAVLHGLAGTVTSAGALLLGLSHWDRHAVDGARFEIARVEALRDRMAAMTTAQRAELAVLGTGRADVFVAGLVILVEALRHCDADTLVVRDRGLRYALV
jgi:exopolyphosphatase/guanosine-5'-triphosphate,3'-diphosphate pyrophosphatase